MRAWVLELMYINDNPSVIVLYNVAEYHVLCIFKALQNSSQWQEYLHLEDFLKFYEVQSLQWKQVNCNILMKSINCNMSIGEGRWQSNYLV